MIENTSVRLLVLMKIAFLIGGSQNRNHRWNGYELRFGNAGVSGTDQSAVAYAEYLASQGHSVIYLTESCLNGTEYKGVKYFDSLVREDYDAIVVFGSLFSHCLLMPWPSVKTVLVYCQITCLPSLEECEKFRTVNPHCKLRAIHVSEWGRKATMHNSPHYSDFIEKDIVIYNPVYQDVIHRVPVETRVPRSFIFHATWFRGGAVARRVHDRLGFSSFVSFNYDLQNGLQGQASVNKAEIMRALSKCDYFVYPLINTHGIYQNIVHKDTFGCVVAEALAMGVIVITWKVAALPELYGDFIQYADFPEGVDARVMEAGRDVREPLLMSDAAVESIARVIETLEADPARKERIRAEGMKFARESFSADVCGPRWKLILSDLMFV